jgi:hypothetical protein
MVKPTKRQSMTQIAKTGLGNAQSALAAANDLRAATQGKALGSRLHLLRDTAAGIKLLRAVGWNTSY